MLHARTPGVAILAVCDSERPDGSPGLDRLLGRDPARETRGAGAHRSPAGQAGGPAGLSHPLAGAATAGRPYQRLPGRSLPARGPDRPRRDGPGLSGPRYAAGPPGGAQDPGPRADQQPPGDRSVPARGAGRRPAPAREPRPDLRLRRVQRPLLPGHGVHRGQDHRRPDHDARADARGDGGTARPADRAGARARAPQGTDPSRRQPLQHPGQPRGDRQAGRPGAGASTWPRKNGSRARGPRSARSTMSPPSRRGILTRPISAATSIPSAARSIT